MKRVRYLAGVVGLAPITLAVATPGVAHAAAGTATGNTKSVALHHIRGVTAAMLNAASIGSVPGSGGSTGVSSASPGAATAGNGCVGRHYSRVADSHSLQTWWAIYGDKLCFGTVKEWTAAFGGTKHHQVRLRVWSESTKGNTRKAFSSIYPATIRHKLPNNSISLTLDFHKEFGGKNWSRAYLCTAWVSDGPNHSSELGPLCTKTH